MSSTFTIEFLPSAARQLAKINRRDQRRISRGINQLAAKPRPPGSILLKGKIGLFRVRVRDFRVIYRIEQERLVVLVVRIARQKEAYRNI